MKYQIFELSNFLNTLEINVKTTKPIPVFDFLQELEKLKNSLIKKVSEDNEITYIAFNERGDITLGESI